VFTNLFQEIVWSFFSFFLLFICFEVVSVIVASTSVRVLYICYPRAHYFVQLAHNIGLLSNVVTACIRLLHVVVVVKY